MSFLDFLASIIESVAWPFFAGWFVYYFREPFTKLLGRLSKFKYKELEAEFKERLGEIEIDDKGVLEGEFVEKLEAEDVSENTVTLDELADISPRAAVLESWIKIEKALNAFLETNGLEKRMSYQGLRRLPNTHRAKIEGILTPYQELRVLRNKAAHGQDEELTPEITRQYIEVAASVERQIRMATK